MASLVLAIVAYIRCFFVPRHRLALEAAALRQQLAVFKRKQPRPKLSRTDRLFWTGLRRLYSGWTDAVILVKPETVVSWHRAGFRLFWRWRSQQPGRPKVAQEIRELIRRMKAENPGWGAARIHGELLQLGFEVSEPTVSRYLQRLKRRCAVTVRTVGGDRYGRLIADVLLEDGRHLNHELVKAGLASWYRRYAPRDLVLQRLEMDARQAGLGL
jgi:hypothetical protein